MKRLLGLGALASLALISPALSAEEVADIPADGWRLKTSFYLNDANVEAFEDYKIRYWTKQVLNGSDRTLLSEDIYQFEYDCVSGRRRILKIFNLNDGKTLYKSEYPETVWIGSIDVEALHAGEPGVFYCEKAFPDKAYKENRPADPEVVRAIGDSLDEEITNTIIIHHR